MKGDTDMTTSQTLTVEMFAGDLVNDLGYRNAAYNILYRLGYTSETVPTFTPGAARWWLALCKEVLEGSRSTALHVLIAEKVPEYQLADAAKLLAL